MSPSRQRIAWGLAPDQGAGSLFAFTVRDLHRRARFVAADWARRPDARDSDSPSLSHLVVERGDQTAAVSRKLWRLSRHVTSRRKLVHEPPRVSCVSRLLVVPYPSSNNPHTQKSPQSSRRHPQRSASTTHPTASHPRSSPLVTVQLAAIQP